MKQISIIDCLMIVMLCVGIIFIIILGTLVINYELDTNNCVNCCVKSEVSE